MQNRKDVSDKAYVITGPTSGIGYETALELAKHGMVILVGRNPGKLQVVEKTIKERGQNAVSVVCDISDMTSIQKAVSEIKKLDLPIAGVLNNAGVMPTKPAISKQGWELTFATNHLGTFLFTELMTPLLPDGATIVSIASAVEDPERKPAKVIGMRGGRYISVEASAKGEWKEGGSKLPGADAYATSKQALLASLLYFSRETPRLHFNAVEPGITPGTGLGGDANRFMHFLFSQIITRIPPFAKYRSTPQKAAKVIAKILISQSGGTGIYYDEKGQPMIGSDLVRNPEFQEKVVSETRAFLSRNSF